MFNKEDKMKVDKEKIIKKFDYLCIFAGSSIILFFMLGFYFDIWGKEFSELPVHVNILMFLIAAIMFILALTLVNHMFNNYDIIKNQKNFKSKSGKK